MYLLSGTIDTGKDDKGRGKIIMLLLKKFRVSATITLCHEIVARNKTEAIAIANERGDMTATFAWHRIKRDQNYGVWKAEEVK